MYCGKCGSLLPEKGRFCPKCGAPYTRATARQAPEASAQQLRSAQYAQPAQLTPPEPLQPAPVQQIQIPQPQPFQPMTAQQAGLSRQPQPAAYHPTKAQPAAARQAVAQQAVAQPATAQPAAAWQPAAQPAAAQPTAAWQPAAQPATAQPTAAWQPAAQPATAQSAATWQAAAQSASTQPAGTNVLGAILAAVALIALAASVGLWIAQALGGAATAADTLGSRGESPAVVGSVLYAVIPAVPSLVAFIAALPVISVLGRTRQGARVPIRALFGAALLAVLCLALVVAAASAPGQFTAAGSDERFVAEFLGSSYSVTAATAMVLAAIALVAEIAARVLGKSGMGR